jgi:hypothetical protein
VSEDASWQLPSVVRTKSRTGSKIIELSDSGSDSDEDIPSVLPITRVSSVICCVVPPPPPSLSLSLRWLLYVVLVSSGPFHWSPCVYCVPVPNKIGSTFVWKLWLRFLAAPQVQIFHYSAISHQSTVCSNQSVAMLSRHQSLVTNIISYRHRWKSSAQSPVGTCNRSETLRTQQVTDILCQNKAVLDSVR